MAINRLGSFDNYMVTPRYLSSRDMALHFPASKLGKFGNNEVYGIVIDMPMNPVLLCTMSVFANGACNLHFNSGIEYTGAATRHQTVIQPARQLLANAPKLLAESERTKQFSLPMNREHYIYLLTKKGVYKKVLSPLTIQTASKEAQTVYVLYQQLLKVMRSAQLQDKEAGVL